MEIIKKSGKLEHFDERKLKTSIANSARDTEGVHLTESDLNAIVKDIKNIIKNIRKDNEKTSSYELIGIINDVLIKNKFHKVLKEFVAFKDKR
ncbi:MULTISPECIES: ATP cone domain-containing protein [Clostridium]|uniref:ATP cone domain-containing protein n=1 Tax=Clostridium TaxID=1485 RepID=UPI000D12AC81|nr:MULTISPECIES: ATP cone domain-containing protein [Clostridium]AVQ46205.1 hypothetical protein C7M60_10605 [Clostridium botulinum]AVQ49823.1 hypothetical protein C7M58_10985 [Clostridium botulinum]EJE7235547.1 hypothetical protein [Clostridium botulinum]EJE7236922.1 hypothetical protein [Clostridium botulinum]EKS4342679.1 hypothetical protein [Clostridium botulinum]